MSKLSINISHHCTQILYTNQLTCNISLCDRDFRDCLKKSIRYVYILNFIWKNFPSCPIHIHEQCYCYMTLVRPQLEYAASVWDNSVQHNIKRQNQCKDQLLDMLVMITDRPPVLQPCSRNSNRNLSNSDEHTAEYGCFTGYVMDWQQSLQHTVST